jgi:hypothetical protein
MGVNPQCEISKNPTLSLTLEWNSKENEIPNSISTLTHLYTFKLIKPRILFGLRQKINVNVNSITSLHNQIQTCIVEWVWLTPKLNDKSNAIYTLTKLQHLELIGCEISELNETISKLTSLQTLLLSNNSELNQLPSSMTKLTSLLHLSLVKTKIQSDTVISVVCQIPSLQVLKLNLTNRFETFPSQISQLTSLQHLSLSFSEITSLPTQIGLFTQLHTLKLFWCDSLNNIPTELEHLTNLRVFRLFGRKKIHFHWKWRIGSNLKCWNWAVSTLKWFHQKCGWWQNWDIFHWVTTNSLLFHQNCIVSQISHIWISVQIKSHTLQIKSNQQTHSTSISQFIIKSIDTISCWYLINSSFEWTVDWQ